MLYILEVRMNCVFGEGVATKLIGSFLTPEEVCHFKETGKTQNNFFKKHPEENSKIIADCFQECIRGMSILTCDNVEFCKHAIAHLQQYKGQLHNNPKLSRISYR